jgi:predicted nucleic acid-binding protein
MGVLVDTSVWIRFLSGRLSYASVLDDLLTQETVAGHELVFGELLIGDIGGRVKLLADYDLMMTATTVPHREVVEFVNARKLHGRGIGWIDAHLLAAAIVDRIQLWTADPRLQILARELGVAYEPPER